jgi:hypothetical protein
VKTWSLKMEESGAEFARNLSLGSRWKWAKYIQAAANLPSANKTTVPTLYERQRTPYSIWMLRIGQKVCKQCHVRFLRLSARIIVTIWTITITSPPILLVRTCDSLSLVGMDSYTIRDEILGAI